MNARHPLNTISNVKPRAGTKLAGRRKREGVGGVDPLVVGFGDFLVRLPGDVVKVHGGAVVGGQFGLQGKRGRRCEQKTLATIVASP